MLPRFAALLVVLAVAGGIVTNGQTPERPQAFLLFVDDLHLDFRHTPRTRKFMQDLLATLFREGDLWSIVTTGTSSLSLQPTSDLATLKSTVSRVTGNALKLDDPRASAAPAEPQNRAIVAYRTAADAITRLAALPHERPLTVLYISSGYDTRVVPPPLPVIEAAVRESARVIASRPWTLDAATAGVPPDVWEAYVAATQEALRTLASETNGIAVFTPADLEPALRLVESNR